MTNTRWHRFLHHLILPRFNTKGFAKIALVRSCPKSLMGYRCHGRFDDNECGWKS